MTRHLHISLTYTYITVNSNILLNPMYHKLQLEENVLEVEIHITTHGMVQQYTSRVPVSILLRLLNHRIQEAIHLKSGYVRH